MCHGFQEGRETDNKKCWKQIREEQMTPNRITRSGGVGEKLWKEKRGNAGRKQTHTPKKKTNKQNKKNQKQTNEQQSEASMGEIICFQANEKAKRGGSHDRRRRGGGGRGRRRRSVVWWKTAELNEDRS